MKHLLVGARHGSRQRKVFFLVRICTKYYQYNSLLMRLTGRMQGLPFFTIKAFDLLGLVFIGKIWFLPPWKF